VYNEKFAEFQSMPQVEEEEPEDLTGEAKEELPNLPNAMDTEQIVSEGIMYGQEGAGEEVKVMSEEEVQAERVKREEAERQKNKMAEERERLRKERAEKREKIIQMKAVLEKLMNSLNEAEQGVSADQQKLEKINEEFGAQLMMFEDGMEGVEEAFLEELHRPESIEHQNPVIVNPDPAIAEETMAEPQAQVGIDKEMTANQEGYVETAGNELKQQQQDSFPSIAEMPVRVILNLKKPLDKFFATNPKNSVIDKEVVEKTSMIVMECNVRQNAEFYLKVFNEVFEGPWKVLRKRPAELPMLPYPLEKTVQYLVKRHKRQEVLDNTVDNCHLCETPLKRMQMPKHLKEFCQMREEPCRFCNKVFVMKAMSEHHNTDCPNFPVSCPQRCFGGKHKRCEVEEHLKVCMNTVVKCRFNSLGCSAILKRKQLRRHKFDEAHKHIDLLEKRMEKLTNYLMDKDPRLHELLNPPEPPSVQEDQPEQKAEGSLGTRREDEG